MSERVSTIRRVVALLMELRGETQKDIAAVLGMSQPQVNQRVNGKVDWRLSELDTLAAHWGVPTTVFLKTHEEIDELEASVRTGLDLLVSRITCSTAA